MNRRDFLGTAAASAGLAAFGCKATGGTRPEPQDTWLEIDLGHIAWNLEQIRRRVNRLPVMAVIKANAYGHGLVETGRFLETQGVRFLAVGKATEALQLRDAGVRAPILNFGSFSRAEASDLVRRGISQTVYTDEARMLADVARGLGRDANVHIKVDTGLGRVGVPAHRAQPFVREIAATHGLAIEGIFTPFTEDDAYDRMQLARLTRVCEDARRDGISVGLRHAASSAGVLTFADGWLDMVRPGIALYGHYPSTRAADERRIDLKPAMSLKARVMYVKTLRQGDSVSYHRAFVAKKRTDVATLSVGYSDGYPHRVAGKADVTLGGSRRSTIGLVTSNHTTVDVTGLRVGVGDTAVLFGPHGGVTAEELAAHSGTSVYKTLIGMSGLLPRRFLRSGESS